MKAIILASGAGRRLRPLTNHLPKSLIDLGNATILDCQLKSLMKHGIDRVIITTGPFKKVLEDHARSKYRVRFWFVDNPRYETTNYIYSLWLTRDLIDEDVLLLHGDLLFEDILIKKLLQAGGNCVLVNRKIEPPDKDFKALIEDGRVIEIGVELFGPNTCYCAPMYRFSRVDFLRWLTEVDSFVRQGNVTCYAEDAFNKISDDIVLQPLYFEEFCMEIDTPGDLQRARDEFLSQHLQTNSCTEG